MGPIESGYHRSRNDRPARPIWLHAFIVEHVVKTVFNTCAHFAFPTKLICLDIFIFGYADGRKCMKKEKNTQLRNYALRLDFGTIVTIIHPEFLQRLILNLWRKFRQLSYSCATKQSVSSSISLRSTRCDARLGSLRTSLLEISTIVTVGTSAVNRRYRNWNAFSRGRRTG